MRVPIVLSLFLSLAFAADDLPMADPATAGVSADRLDRIEDAMETGDIFRIYSMTKPITSVAVMMLLEEGHFLLTDPVSNFLPELKGLEVLVENRDPDSGRCPIQPCQQNAKS
jgi:hypothetical protein